MNRQEIYAKIKELNLAQEMKEYFGVSYTNVSNSELEEYLKDMEPEYDNFEKLVRILQDKRILLQSEVDYILND